MNARVGQSPRFQDLSRQEAFGVEARLLQRMLPLLIPRKHPRQDKLEFYFKSLTKFIYLLANVGLGNISSGDAKMHGEEFHKALHCEQLLADPSIPAAMAIMCVTDALGELECIRYIPKPGLATHDEKNPDLDMLSAHAEFTLSKFGMIGCFFRDPTVIDCVYVFEHRAENETTVDPSFFARDLWPSSGTSFADRAKPFGFKTIENDWRDALNALGLSGIVATYDGLLNGMHLVQNHKVIPKEAKVTNYVTLNFSNGASFTGPLAVGQNIELSYEMANDIKSNSLRDKLEELVGLASKLAEAIEPEDMKNDVSTQVKTFVAEAKKDKPSRWGLDVSSAGLLEAAKTVASLAGPVTTSVKSIMELINPTS
jgi:hypothetical protein